MFLVLACQTLLFLSLAAARLIADTAAWATTAAPTTAAAVPLVRAVQQGPTGFVVVPGARVMRGDGPGDGFGLGGSPGRWSTLYNQSPADFGLPAAVGVLGSDGTRGWVLSGQFLAQLLGSNWQQVIS